MRIKSNKLIAIREFFDDELKDLYHAEEIRYYFYWCCESFLGLSKQQVINDPDLKVSESLMLKFNFAVKDLKNHRPIQYVCQNCDFYNLRLSVNEAVLIPRPETEQLVDWIVKDLAKVDKQVQILDICTGSGCIALALKKQLPDADIEALDISKEAILLAEQNAKANQLNVVFHCSDIQDFKSDKTYDIVVSNPPYVRESEKKDMQKNVLDYEPGLALFVDDDNPLKFYDIIADFADRHLKKGGALYFEINEALPKETAQLLQDKGFRSIEIKTDFRDKPRMIKCVK